MKTKDELIYEHACSLYDHIANEPQFDCKMADFQLSDLHKLLDKYADQQTTELREILKECREELTEYATNDGGLILRIDTLLTKA